MKRFLLAAFLWLSGTPAFAGISCSLPFNLINGVTADATQIMANYNALVACLALAAHAGNNTDITSISGLTTPIPPPQGGSTVFVGGNGTLTGSTYIVTTTVPANFTLQKGYSVIFVANQPNPGAASLNVTGTGVINLFKQTTAGPVALSGLEIAAGDIVNAVYDGTQFQITAPVINTGPPTMGGRLVPTNVACSNTPSIVYTNIAAVTSLCYVPYLAGVGNLVWVNGANFTYTPLTLTLNVTHQTGGNIYDIFVTTSGGVALICAGGNPWANTTARTDAITLNANGIYQNNGTLSNCWNSNTNSGPIAAGGATYIGTIIAIANGQSQWSLTPVQLAGGTNNVLGVYNAYNRVPVLAHIWDATASYSETLGTGTYNRVNNANTTGCTTPGVGSCNSVTWVDGLGVVGAGSTMVKVHTALTYNPPGSVATANGGATLACPDYDNVGNPHACTANATAGCAALNNQVAYGQFQAGAIASSMTANSTSFCSSFGQHSINHLVSFPNGLASGGPQTVQLRDASGMVLDTTM
jgi:hypothetical protein